MIGSNGRLRPDLIHQRKLNLGTQTAYLNALTVPNRYRSNFDGAAMILVKDQTAHLIGTQREHYYYHGDG